MRRGQVVAILAAASLAMMLALHNTAARVSADYPARAAREPSRRNSPHVTQAVGGGDASVSGRQRDSDFDCHGGDVPATRLTCVAQPFAGSPARPSSVPLLHDAVVETDRAGNATVIHAVLPTREDGEAFALAYSLCAAGSWNPGADDGAGWDTHLRIYTCDDPGDAGSVAELRRRCHSRRRRDAAADAIVWHVPREDLHPYHSLYERGAAAIGMQHAAVARQLRVPGLRNVVQPTFIAHPDLVDPYIVTSPSARASTEEKKMKNTRTKHAVQVLFEALGGIDEYRWPPARFDCARLQGVGILRESPMTYITDGWRAHAEALQQPLTALHRNMVRRLRMSFGPRAGTATTSEEGAPDPALLFLHDGRAASPGFDDQDRARGVQPFLLTELERAFAARALPSTRVTGRFAADVPIESQWLQLQWPRVVVAGEGAFFSLMSLAQTNTTFVMIYNHTRRPEQWLHSTFHAVVAVSVPWVRLVVYSVHGGDRAPVSELARVVAAPFEPGVFFVGADADGRPPAHQL